MNKIQKLSENINNINIADDLDATELDKISRQCKEDFKNDVDSRSDWEENVEEWIKLANQVVEKKTYPWPNASNVKYPLVTVAAMQFAARAYPSLVPANGNVVNCKVVGFDPDTTKSQAAQRISKYMTFQCLDEMSFWEEDMDKALINVPIVGTVFKKTYYSSDYQKNISELVLAKDLVVNYWAKDLEKARKTQILYLTNREVEERKRQGLYSDVDLGTPYFEQIGKLHTQEKAGIGNAPAENDKSTPYTILEQHTWYDLDDDGYEEPYIVTFDYKSGKVLRIIARYSEDTIHVGADNKLVKIVPIEYYTKYGFLPNPDGGFYDLGFGLLLGPINHSVNTIINQLVDAGSLSNLQSGFIGRGLTLKGGVHSFKPGEWKVVNPVADDIKKGLFPLPVREPSNVLFQLLGMLIQSGKELASVAEIFVGKMPGQNTPATTTQVAVEEGMRLFTAIYKRLYRSMTQEFRKLYTLNCLYPPADYEDFIMGDPTMGQATAQDFDLRNKYKILPAADPTTASQAQRLAKAQSLMQLVQTGFVNPQEAIKRTLEAQEQEGIEALMANAPATQPKGPDPEQQQMEMEAHIKQQEAAMKAEMQQQQAAIRQKEAELRMIQQQQQASMKQMSDEMKLKFDTAMKQMELQMLQAKAAIEVQQGQNKLYVESRKANIAEEHQKAMSNLKETEDD